MIEGDINKIKDLINEFFKKTGFNIEVSVLSVEDKTIPVRIKTEEPEILIGQNGETLADTQHLLKAILSHEISEQFYVDLDINDYKERKIKYLKESAKEWADDVSLTGQEKTLDPMPAFERRIIHMELAERTDVNTESVGQGVDRKIIIKPN